MAGKKRKKWDELLTFNNCLQPPFTTVGDEHEIKGIWRKNIFKNDHPIVLELGCGRGEYCVNLGKAFPNKNFIGIDIKGSRIWKGAKAAYQNKLSNVYFLRTRIDFLTNFFSTNEVDEIWITFPDPQPKKQKKRLTSPVFLDRYINIINSKTGQINLKTDNISLYLYSKAIMSQHGLILNHDLFDVHASLEDKNLSYELELALGIKTYYENLFTQKGHRTYYLNYSV